MFLEVFMTFFSIAIVLYIIFIYLCKSEYYKNNIKKKRRCFNSVYLLSSILTQEADSIIGGLHT
jgi:hypothetical protein